MQQIYDNRIKRASANTTFALDGYPPLLHGFDMESSDQILATLKAQGVTQAKIARVLGVEQPNVNTLYKPSKRTGKTRKLTYDEGIKLMAEFGLDDKTSAPDVFNEQTLAPILRALLPLVPAGNVSESAVEALALALRHALALLPAHGATAATEDEMKMAARAAVVRFREAWRA